MLSIIICTRDPKRFETVEGHYNRLLAGIAHEIIRVDNPRSLAAGYNHGIDQARGDYLIFSHDDVEPVCDDFFQRLHQHLQHFDLVGLAGTNKLINGFWGAACYPYIFGQVAYPNANGPGYGVSVFNCPAAAVGGIQAFDGLFFAVRRQVVEKVRFDPVTFDGFHLYDLDFSFASFRAGFKLAVACDMPVIHSSPGKIDTVWKSYAERFDVKYQGKTPMGPIRPSAFSGVWVLTRQELVEVMRPPWMH